MKRFLSLLSLVMVLASCIAQNKVTQSVSFPMHPYLTTITGTPYPTVNAAAIAVDQSKLTNVMDYGAKGDGKTNDDAAIKKALTAAKYGVLFPSGKTFIVSDLIKLNISNDLIVYAYGATIRKAEMSGYGWLDVTGRGKQFIWLGGTLDGNQYNQQWFGNPHGGKYNGALLGHNRLLGGISLNFFFVKDVNLVNSVMDGFNGESTVLTVYANCHATGGANFHYNTETGSNGKREAGAGDQGTYFKGRITGDNQHVYILNCTATGGSITVQMSYPDPRDGTTTMPHNTVCYIGGCDFKNGAQDLLHFEDCYVNIIYNSKIGCDADGNFYQPRIWVSNRTGVFYMQNCTVYNSTIHFGARAEMKLAMINGGAFSSTISYGNKAMDGADIVANASFTGTGIEAYYVKNCAFKNSNSAIGKAKVVTGCTFDNSKGGSNMGSGSADIFNSYLSVLDDKGKSLGTLNAVLNGTTGGDTGTTGDTTHATKGDTIIITKYVHDTVRYYLHDSVKIYVHDTVKFYFHDTVKISTPAHDTIYITMPVHDTVKLYIYDTVKTSFHDTVKTYVHDTLYKSYPVYIHDTVYVHDSNGGDTGGGDVTPPAYLQVGLLPYQHADALGLPIGRNRFVVSNGNGLEPMKRYSGKMQFSPSVVWIAKEFPTDLVEYEKKLAVLANGIGKDKMPFIQLENEPNYNETHGDVNTYIQMCKIAVKLFGPKGIDVYSGGLTFAAMAAYCSQLYQKDGDTKNWQVFKNNGFTNANNESLAWITQYIQNIKDGGIPINFNFHCHVDEKSLAVLPLVVAKLKQVIKGKIICGECSFDKQNAAWVAGALNALKGIDGVMLYSEENGGTTAVKFNTDMDNAVKAFLKQ